MERAEKIGLGVAATGHIILFGLLSLNLIWNDDTPKLGDPAVEITIAGDPGSSPQISDIPLPIASPDPTVAEDTPDEAVLEDELLPSEPDEVAPSPSTPPDSKVLPPDRSAELARQRAADQRKRREAEDRKKRESDAKRKREADAKRKRDADAKARRDAAAAQRRAEIANAVNAASSGPPAKNAGQVRGEVNIAIGRQIRPFLSGCTPNGVDVRSITTRVTLKLNRNGSLAGISGVRQTGINDNNRPQAGPMENCVISAIKSASPFTGLDDDYYDIWQSHKMAFRGT